MTGDLRIEPDPAYPPARHDHLVLTQAERALVFSDPRQFGRVTFDVGREAPLRWRELPPEVLSSAFTPALLGEFLRRHARAPVKAVLLRQERFPGIGNWMADEVLYRSRIHPGVAAGSLDGDEVARLHREIRTVSRVALRRIGERWGDLPRDWLFHRRWEDGGICPRTGAGLVRETIGGRTTCYSPEWQGEARRSATGSRRSPTSSRRPGSGSRRGDGEPESSKA
jgi:formamidopyrimidine-DNA glycosylase